jgi:hypothetical protein
VDLLLLLHKPGGAPLLAETWRALEDCLREVTGAGCRLGISGGWGWGTHAAAGGRSFLVHTLAPEDPTS